jgi:hypothetical protein
LVDFYVCTIRELEEEDEQECSFGWVRSDRSSWPRMIWSAHLVRFFSLLQNFKIQFGASKKIEKNANEVSLDSSWKTL